MTHCIPLPSCTHPTACTACTGTVEQGMLSSSSRLPKAPLGTPMHSDALRHISQVRKPNDHVCHVASASVLPSFGSGSQLCAAHALPETQLHFAIVAMSNLYKLVQVPLLLILRVKDSLSKHLARCSPYPMVSRIGCCLVTG